MTLPGRFPGRLGRASTLLLNLIPDGKIAAAETGQALTFARTTVGGYATDTLGRVRSTIHSQPKYEAVDLDGDGIRETLGLLLEPARTNVLARSQEFDNAAWSKNRATVTANATTAPDGSLTADRIVETTGTGNHDCEQGIGALTASTYTPLSVFLKAGERTWGALTGFKKDGTSVVTYYDLANGVLGTVPANCLARMERYGDGWWRCFLAYDAGTGATAGTMGVGIATGDGGYSYTGDATKGLYAWGAQAEVDQPFASTYVPTTTAAVTKNADALSLTAAWPVQDITVYAKVARPWWADISGTIPFWGFMKLGSGTPYLYVYSQDAARTFACGWVDDASGAGAVAANIPAGNVLEVCAQFVNIRSAVKCRIDVGAGFTSFTSPGGSVTHNTSYRFSIGGTDPFPGVLLAHKVAAGARTMDQMRGAY